MELTGLTLGQLAALFGAAATVVTALYMLKLRRRTIVVPFVLLWDRLLADKQATSLFSQIKRWLSLLLALLLVALLSLALGDPRYAESSNELRHRVLLIDAGISMQAREGKSDRLRQAVEQARALIEGLGTKDRMMIVQVDRSVTPLSPMTNDASVLKLALDKLAATDVISDLRAGVALAEDVLRGHSLPEITLISDGTSLVGDLITKPDRIQLTQIKVGQSTRDVAITAFAVRRFPLDKTRSELLLELNNSSAQAASFEIKLSGDGRSIEVQKAQLAANERKRIVYDDITGVDRSLQVELVHTDSAHDVLRANDRAYATLPERKRMRVLCVTEGNRYLEAALLLDEYLSVDVTTPASYVPDPSYDVVIFDRNTPATAVTQPAIYIAAPSTSDRPGPLRVDGVIERPYFDKVARQDPVLRHVALRDVNVAAAQLATTEAGDTVIAADARGPLIVSGKRNTQPFVALTFDVTQSDLPLRVAWPMLLINTLDSFAQQQAGYIDNYRAGERGVMKLAQEQPQPQWIDPTGKARPLPVSQGRAVIDEARAGLYTLKTQDTERLVAINPAAVASLQPRAITASTQTASAARAKPKAAISEQPWAYLLLAGLLLLAVEWLTFHRRWTV